MDCVCKELACVSQLFEVQARRRDNHVAIVYKDNKFTYDQLNKLSNVLANELIEQGVGRESIIGVYSDFTPDAVIAILAILKTGASYFIINLKNPTSKIEHLLRTSNVSIVLVSTELKSNFIKTLVDTIDIKSSISSLLSATERTMSNLAPISNKDDIAYIMYTSGSSGEPKGVVIERRSLIKHINTYIELCDISESDTFLGLYPLWFDASVEIIFPILCAGGTLVLCGHDEMKDMSIIVDAITRNGVSLLGAPPVILNIINEEQVISLANTSLRRILTGGDVLKFENVNNLIKYATVMNGYGVTEATVSSTWHVISDNDSKSIPIGKPLKDAHVYLLDDSLKHVSYGEVGEICIAGYGLARGYLNDEEKTKEKFISVQFSANIPTRLYKTGDLGRLLPNGELEFLGRKDNQISIRGFRIEPGEIEFHLKKIPWIKEAVVCSKECGNGKRLEAYIVAKQEILNETCDFIEDIADVKKISRFLSESIPDYMIPSSYVLVDNIPRNDSGKIRINELCHMDGVILGSTDDELKCSYVSPASEEEKLIQEIWAEVLMTPMYRLSVDCDFFEVGGDSLLLTVLLNKIRKKFKVDFTIKQLLSTLTIKEQAVYIKHHQQEIDDEENLTQNRTLRIIKTQRKDMYQLSSSQRRIWFTCKMDPLKSVAYNTVSANRLSGKLDVKKFLDSLNAVLSRNDIFSANFAIYQGMPYQFVRKDTFFNLKTISLRGMDIQEQQNEIKKLIRNELTYKFDIENDILVRISLVQLNSEEYVMVGNIHHIIIDNVSWEIVLRDIKSMYEEDYDSDSLAHKEIDYFDYCDWENKFYETDEIVEQKNYWMHVLENQSQSLDLPFTKQKLPVLSSNGMMISFELDREIIESLKGISKKNNVTNFCLLLSLFNILLYCYTQQDDLVIGVPVANRHISGAENIVGIILNMLPIRNKINPQMTVSSFSQQCGKKLVQAYNNQDYPFEKIVENLRIKRDTSHSPVFQVMFDYYGENKGKYKVGDVEFTPIKVPTIYSKYELSVSIHSSNDSSSMMFDFEFNTDLFDESDIKRIMDNYKYLLQNITEVIDTKIDELNLLNEDDKECLKCKVEERKHEQHKNLDVSKSSSLVQKNEYYNKLPDSPTEKTIYSIWENILGLMNFSIHDNFFDIGGSSILLLRMIEDINARLSKKLNIIDLFNYPTVSSLSKFIEQNAPAQMNFEELSNRIDKQRQALRRFKNNKK